MLSAHFIGGPAVGEVIHDNLGYANARHASRARFPGPSGDDGIIATHLSPSTDATCGGSCTPRSVTWRRPKNSLDGKGKAAVGRHGGGRDTGTLGRNLTQLTQALHIAAHYIITGLYKCGKQDLNLHDLLRSLGPQPSASANSAIPADWSRWCGQQNVNGKGTRGRRQERDGRRWRRPSLWGRSVGGISVAAPPVLSRLTRGARLEGHLICFVTARRSCASSARARALLRP